MQHKVYPRLERKKLRRVNAGKRPYKSADDKTDFQSLFERNFSPTSYASIDAYGRLVKGSLTSRYSEDTVCSSNDDTEYCTPASSEFDNINLSFDEILSLRDATLDGYGPTVFAKLIEAKAAGGTFIYKKKVSRDKVAKVNKNDKTSAKKSAAKPAWLDIDIPGGDAFDGAQIRMYAAAAGIPVHALNY